MSIHHKALSSPNILWQIYSMADIFVGRDSIRKNQSLHLLLKPLKIDCECCYSSKREEYRIKYWSATKKYLPLNWNYLICTQKNFFVSYNNNALKELNDCIGGLLHLGLNVITFRNLLHLGPNVITFRTLLHLGLQQTLLFNGAFTQSYKLF